MTLYYSTGRMSAENSYASDMLFNIGIHAELKGLILDQWNN